MNKLNIAFSVLLGMLLSCTSVPSQKHERQLARAISKMSNNVYCLTGYNGWGGNHKGWKNQERIKSIATDDDLDSLARYCSIPAVRALAFSTLAQKQSERCFDILISSLSDSSTFEICAYDIWGATTIASYFQDVACYDEDGKERIFFTDIQKHLLDSLVKSFNLNDVDVKPSFQNDTTMANFQKWVKANMWYPEDQPDAFGRVIVDFDILPDGHVSNVIITRGLCESIDNVIHTVIISSPQWTPGEKYGQKCTTRIRGLGIYWRGPE